MGILSVVCDKEGNLTKDAGWMGSEVMPMYVHISQWYK